MRARMRIHYRKMYYIKDRIIYTCDILPKMWCILDYVHSAWYILTIMYYILPAVADLTLQVCTYCSHALCT